MPKFNFSDIFSAKIHSFANIQVLDEILTFASVCNELKDALYIITEFLRRLFVFFDKRISCPIEKHQH